MATEPGHDTTAVDIAEWAEQFRDAGRIEGLSAGEVLARARREARRDLLDWGTQIGGTLFATVVFLGLVVWKGSMLFAAFAGFVLPVLFALFGYFAYLHIGSRRAAAASLSDHVSRAVKRNRVRYLVARASLAAQALLAIGFWVWLPLFVVSHGDRFQAEPWRLAVAVIAALAIFGVSFWKLVVNVRKSRENLNGWLAVQGSVVDPGTE